jgi:hypothetical protein
VPDASSLARILKHPMNPQIRGESEVSHVSESGGGVLAFAKAERLRGLWLAPWPAPLLAVEKQTGMVCAGMASLDPRCGNPKLTMNCISHWTE